MKEIGSKKNRFCTEKELEKHIKEGMKEVNEKFNKAKNGCANELLQILNERQENYGAFEDHAALSQNLKNCVRIHPNYSGLTKPQKEALEMILHKVGRIVNGNPDYIDSWVDISGYAQLVVNILKK